MRLREVVLADLVACRERLKGDVNHVAIREDHREVEEPAHHRRTISFCPPHWVQTGVFGSMTGLPLMASCV